MKRSALILAALAVTLTLAGCGSRSIGNKIDDQFLGPEVASRISNAHADLSSPTSRIVVTSYNGVILLAGQTPRSEAQGSRGANRARGTGRKEGLQRTAGATAGVPAGTQQRLATDHQDQDTDDCR